MKRLLLIMFSVFCCVQLYAQRTVSGKITDGDSGEGLPGVTVQIKGTSSGAATDLDGNFTISVSDGAVLVVSYVGFVSQEIAVNNRTTVDVVLQPDTELLQEIVVIGYGQTTIKDATGAVAAVQSKDFNGGIISSPEQLIQGKTAGVQITSVSGNPGDGVQLRIRGTNSVRSNNNPLFVVDGVPLSGGATASPNIGDIGTSSDVNPLNFINPADIQSVNILKDASATAIYGSRGANGVIIITTKTGKGIDKQLNYSGSVSLSTPAQTYDLLDGPEFIDAIGNPSIVIGGDAAGANFGSNTDWQDVVLRNSVSTKHYLSYSKNLGGNTTLRPSFGYENQNGILENSNMERITGRINSSTELMGDRLKINLNTTYSSVDREDPPLSGSAGFRGDLLGAAYSANPTWPDDPNYDNLGGQVSPANMLENYRSTALSNRLLANLSAEFKVSDNLTVKGTYGADYSDADRVAFLSPNALNMGDGVQDFGVGGVNNNKSFSNLFELTGTYKKDAGDWNIEILAGYSVQSFRNWGYWGVAYGFNGGDALDDMEGELQSSFDAADAIAQGIYGDLGYSQWGFSNTIQGNDLSGSAVPDGTTGFVNRISGENFETTYANRGGIGVDAIAANFWDNTDYLQSYFGRGNFTYNNKYILTVTVRADGSSKFGEDERVGVFPSFAAAWKLSEESFVPDIFSTLKLRGGYGVTGNQDGLTYGQFVRRERWGDVNVDAGQRLINFPGTTTQGEANPNLKWEQTVQTAFGLDFGVNNERFSGTFDWYLKETEDLLLNVQLAQPALATQRFENLADGIVENKGWELSLGYDIIDNGNMLFSVNGNIAQNKNELKNFGGQLNAGTIRGQGLSGAFAQALAGGRPLFSYFIREFEGFDANGQPLGDVQQFIGKTALPEWNMGLSLGLEVGNFDWSAYMTGQFGHYIYNNTQNAFFTAGSIGSGRNVTRDVLSLGESSQAAAPVSTRFLSPGDFVRMQSMTFGYNVPVESNASIKSLRVTFNMQNLFLITDYNGLDPEVSVNPASFDLLSGLPTAGIDYSAYPRPRTFTLGVTASF